MNNTISVSEFKGIPIINYNSIVGKSDERVKINGKVYDGFYISYNNYDVKTYGDVTTALVLGQMEKFYILNGNHSKAYEEIMKGGFSKCMKYFKNHIEQVNRYSDK